MAYVSLPHFRSSHQIKEFAFVEFESRASVLKAINSFAQFGGALNMSSDPEKLVSVTAYLREQEEGDNKMPAEEQKSSQGCVKQVPLIELDEEPATKKVKLASPDTPSAMVADTADRELNKEQGDDKLLLDNDAEANEDAEEEEDDATKKKVRRKKSTSKHHTKSSGEQQLDASVNTLRITTKLEWKRLRNKYLNQQREKVKQLKKQLWLQQKPTRPKGPPPANKEIKSEGLVVVTRGSRAKSEGKINRNPKKINFYGANKDVGLAGNEEAVRGKAESGGKPLKIEKPVTERTPLFSYEPGIIAKVLTFKKK